MLLMFYGKSRTWSYAPEVVRQEKNLELCSWGSKAREEPGVMLLMFYGKSRTYLIRPRPPQPGRILDLCFPSQISTYKANTPVFTNMPIKLSSLRPYQQPPLFCFIFMWNFLSYLQSEFWRSHCLSWLHCSKRHLKFIQKKKKINCCDWMIYKNNFD